MADKSQGLKGLDRVLSLLNMAVGALDRAKEATNATPAKAAFTSAGILLTMIRVGFPQFMLVDCRLMYVGLDGQQNGLCRTRANLL